MRAKSHHISVLRVGLGASISGEYFRGGSPLSFVSRCNASLCCMLSERHQMNVLSLIWPENSFKGVSKKIEMGRMGVFGTSSFVW